MRRISLALALLGAVAAAGCGGAGNKSSGSTGTGGSKGVAEGTFSITIQNGQNGNTGLAITGGYVKSDPPGIDCGVAPHNACSASFAMDSLVTLTATPSTGKLFFGWAADCFGMQNTCVISEQAADQYVLAMFGTEADRTGHPNWSDGGADHGPAAKDALAGIAGALQCAGCHGAALTGNGLAVSCANCHAGSATELTRFDAASGTTVATGETCASCHYGQGQVHQDIYNKYVDSPTLVASITKVEVSANADATYATTVTFTLKKGGTAFDIAKLTQKRYSATLYDATTKTFDTATAVSFAAAKTVTTGTYTVKAASAKFDVTNPGAGKGSFLYFYFGEGLLIPTSGHYNIMDNVASVSKVYGTIDYVSSANTSGCEKCHGAPYMKHGYRAANVAGLPDMVACKACHTDQRVGTDFDWQVLANDPAALASVTANGTEEPDWTVGFGLATAANYQYVANVMNDTHMSHAMEFPYPMSMANCITCHAGKLDVVTADSKFVGVTCKSCHPTTSLVDTAKRAPSFAGPALGTALAYHDFDWMTNDVKETSTSYDPGTDTTTVTVTHVACNECHADDIADGFTPGAKLDPADPKATDGVGPMLFGLAAPVPLFKDLHGGFDSRMFADSAGASYKTTVNTAVTSATYDPATKKITATFTMSGLAANAIVKPTVVVSLYGYGTKDFVISGHSSQFSDKTPNLEWSEGAVIRGTTTSANTNRLTVSPNTATAGTTAWTIVADLTTWGPSIAASIVKAEVGFLPQLGIDQTVAPQCDATKAAYNQCIAVAGTSATVDLVTGAQDNAMYGKDIVDPAKCNKCHGALAVEFHSPNYGSAGVVGCRLCHFVGTGGSHLEMQSRSIDSYIHAIHSFQKMDVNTVNFADDVQTMEYNHHVESTYPNFTTLNCESCHNPGKYDVPNQTKSLPAILSASSVLTGKSRAIPGTPSVVTGPAAKACGGCHRAELIKEDNAAGLGSYDAHTKAFGYRELPPAGKTTTDVFFQLINALFP